MRNTSCTFAIIAVCICTAGISRADDLMFGCWSRPACGKYCKLVCETKKIPAVGYGYKCETICIPCPSKQGYKHCYTTCCGDTELEGCPPKIEFCWYDWFACGCAKPRTVKLLTKYQAEHEICWYRWEVVDACAEADATVEETNAEDGSDGLLQHPLVYKPAPEDAQLGDVLPITDDERATLAAYLPAEQRAKTNQYADNEEAASQSGKPATIQPQVHAASATSPTEPTSVTQRVIEFFNR